MSFYSLEFLSLLKFKFDVLFVELNYHQLRVEKSVLNQRKGRLSEIPRHVLVCRASSLEQTYGFECFGYEFRAEEAFGYVSGVLNSCRLLRYRLVYILSFLKLRVNHACLLCCWLVRYHRGRR